MKLLLTSGGLANEEILGALEGLLGRGGDSAKITLEKNTLAGVRVLFCTTAANWEGGNMSDWLVKDLVRLRELGCAIDVCDINGVGVEKFLPRFEWAEVLYFEGGNAQWLRRAIRESGLEAHLGELLRTRVWVGASAGSIVLCPTVRNAWQDWFDEYIEGYEGDGLGLVDFQFVPHLGNPNFPGITMENLRMSARELREEDGKKGYVVSDAGAVVVDGKAVRVVGGGGEVVEVG